MTFSILPIKDLLGQISLGPIPPGIIGAFIAIAISLVITRDREEVQKLLFPVSLVITLIGFNVNIIVQLLFGIMFAVTILGESFERESILALGTIAKEQAISIGKRIQAPRIAKAQQRTEGRRFKQFLISEAKRQKEEKEKESALRAMAEKAEQESGAKTLNR